MTIGVIQASSQAAKNELIYDSVKTHAADCDVINFGCTPDEDNQYSYIEISILIGLLLSSQAVDFIVTGCSSGQGMMLACNNMPGVLCGYCPTPRDAYLFAQILERNIHGTVLRIWIRLLLSFSLNLSGRDIRRVKLPANLRIPGC